MVIKQLEAKIKVIKEEMVGLESELGKLEEQLLMVKIEEEPTEEMALLMHGCTHAEMRECFRRKKVRC